MTMPTPEQAARRVDRLVEIARAFADDPDNSERRFAYVKATFNLDWTAATIVALADSLGGPQDDVGLKTIGWAALATNSNIRLWSRNKSQVQQFASQHGCELVRIGYLVGNDITRLLATSILVRDHARPSNWEEFDDEHPQESALHAAAWRALDDALAAVAETPHGRAARLIDRIADLNPGASEIGAGMLAQLVTEARAIRGDAA